MRRRKFDPGRWEVQRERLHIAEATPPSDHEREPQALSSILPQILKKWGLQSRLWERQLLEEWDALVGPQVSRHSRPGRLESGTLWIYVRHPVWLSDLSRYGQQTLLANLQSRFGADHIKALRLCLDPDEPSRNG